jgi:hypothetical protein
MGRIRKNLSAASRIVHPRSPQGNPADQEVGRRQGEQGRLTMPQQNNQQKRYPLNKWGFAEFAVDEYLPAAGWIILILIVALVLFGPWMEWDKYGHQRGWALLGVVVDLLGAAIAALFVAAKIAETRRDGQPRQVERPLWPPATAPDDGAAQAFEERARRVAASTIELRDIDDPVLRARVKNIREAGRGL